MVYQETLKIDVKKIAKKRQYGGQYMKLLMLRFMKKQIFSTRFFNLGKKIK